MDCGTSDSHFWREVSPEGFRRVAERSWDVLTHEVRNEIQELIVRQPVGDHLVYDRHGDAQLAVARRTAHFEWVE
jgi:hypothetical protein